MNRKGEKRGKRGREAGGRERAADAKHQASEKSERSGRVAGPGAAAAIVLAAVSAWRRRIWPLAAASDPCLCRGCAGWVGEGEGLVLRDAGGKGGCQRPT